MDFFNMFHFVVFVFQIIVFTVGAYNVLRGNKMFYPVMFVGAVFTAFESWAMLQ